MGLVGAEGALVGGAPCMGFGGAEGALVGARRSWAPGSWERWARWLGRAVHGPWGRGGGGRAVCHGSALPSLDAFGLWLPAAALVRGCAVPCVGRAVRLPTRPARGFSSPERRLS